MGFYSGEQPITLEERTGGYGGGPEYTESVANTETIWGAVWIPDRDEFEQLEIGERRENTRMVETRFELSTGDDGETTESASPADVLVIEGERYKVVAEIPELYPRSHKFNYTAIALEND